MIRSQRKRNSYCVPIEKTPESAQEAIDTKPKGADVVNPFGWLLISYPNLEFSVQQTSN